jgi:hypothetical protein
MYSNQRSTNKVNKSQPIESNENGLPKDFRPKIIQQSVSQTKTNEPPAPKKKGFRSWSNGKKYLMVILSALALSGIILIIRIFVFKG